jgi:class 3 adenylate cyclase
MNATEEKEDARRIQRALLAHLRQEFLAPAAAIVGYVDILIDDARRLSLDAFLPDLERIQRAGHGLHALLQSVLANEHASDGVIFDRAKLRHDLRTPINAIKGYGEMLVEDASDGGHEVLLADLDKLLKAANGVLTLIDALVDFRGEAGNSAMSKPPAGMGGFVEAIRAIRAVDAAPAGREIHGRILIVDDTEQNRDLLERQLSRAGHNVVSADGGRPALQVVMEQPFDLILLDMMMPDISGYEVLVKLKADSATAEIPVIMVSALDDVESVMRCIEAGAVDYLLKPFEPTLLRARIGSSVENKILRDREKMMVEELRREKARSESLLLSILPQSVVDRINAGAAMIADRVDEVSILFADIVGFTPMAGRHDPADVVHFLNEIFTAFDAITDEFGGEKIKTIGDAYMVAFGLPDPRRDHVEAAAGQALAMLDRSRSFRTGDGAEIRLRIGIHTGSAVAGVIGQRKFSFDVWGATVNIASRMESLGEPGRIHVSEAVAQALGTRFTLVDRGPIEVKGAGTMRTFFLAGQT